MRGQDAFKTVLDRFEDATKHVITLEAEIVPANQRAAKFERLHADAEMQCRELIERVTEIKSRYYALLADAQLIANGAEVRGRGGLQRKAAVDRILALDLPTTVATGEQPPGFTTLA